MVLDKVDYTNWSKEELVKEIKKLKKRKKFGLVWDEEKTKEEFNKNSIDKIPILKEIRNKKIQTDKNSPTNIIIEGDNFHALSVLNYTHAKRVATIYIDPPYNTGAEFRYNDKIINPEDGYRHSKWLSFMRKRLLLAKKLLKESGIIFISINDIEQAHLKILCSEIFGENMFIGQFVWKSRQQKDNRNVTGASIDHEYVLCYGKRVRGDQRKREAYSNPDNDPRGDWSSENMVGILPKELRPNCHYDLINPKTGINYGKPKLGWRYDKNTMSILMEEDKIIFPNSSTGRPRRKKFFSELKQDFTGFSSIIGNGIYTKNGTSEIDKIFGSRVMDFPKPSELIKQLIIQGSNNDDVILDFFAGSGTTGHAVLELNKEDKGNRKFILCTNNENNICIDVCYPRIQKIIKGYTSTKNEKIKGLGGNLKYFKTDFVDAEPTDKNKKKLVDQCTEMLCLREDCFDELKQTKNYSIFKNHEEKHLGIIYDDEGIEPLKKQIKSTGKKFNVYVFSLDDSAREEEFEDVIDMVDLKPIPEVILNVYRRIFR